MLKQVKWTVIGLGVLEIAAGILLIMFPQLSQDVICYLIGIGACLIGVIYLIKYFLLDMKEALYSNEFIAGGMILLFGLVVIIKKELILNLIPILLGMLIVFSGFIKIQRSVTAFRIKYDKAFWYLLIGIISIVCGLVIMFVLSPKQTSIVIYKVAGAGLVYCGITDLLTVFLLAGHYNRFIAGFESGQPINVPATEPEHQSEVPVEPVTDNNTPGMPQ